MVSSSEHTRLHDFVLLASRGYLLALPFQARFDPTQHNANLTNSIITSVKELQSQRSLRLALSRASDITEDICISQAIEAIALAKTTHEW